MEASFVRTFPSELRDALVNSFTRPLRDVGEPLFFERGFRVDYEFLWDRLLRRASRVGDEPLTLEIIEAFSRLEELRRSRLRQIPDYEKTAARLIAASSVRFSLSGIAYNTLDFGVAVGGIKQLAGAFESDFDSVRVFFDAFIPQAFVESLSLSHSTLPLKYDVQYTSRFERRFHEASVKEAPTQTAPVLATAAVPSSMTRAGWLWWVANGTLVIPVAVLLAVLYFTTNQMAALYETRTEAQSSLYQMQIQALSSLQDRENQTLRPILDYYKAALALQQLEIKTTTAKRRATPSSGPSP
jgi:hypothetical protein